MRDPPWAHGPVNRLRAASLHIEYPMLFRLEGVHSKRETHCGVLEFIAEEGVVYMPHWVSEGNPAKGPDGRAGMHRDTGCRHKQCCCARAEMGDWRACQRVKKIRAGS